MEISGNGWKVRTVREGSESWTDTLGSNMATGDRLSTEGFQPWRRATARGWDLKSASNSARSLTPRPHTSRPRWGTPSVAGQKGWCQRPRRAQPH